MPTVNVQAAASLLSFQMAWPYYDGIQNATPNPHCSALSVFPRQQSLTIWKALILQFLLFLSNGFLSCLDFTFLLGCFFSSLLCYWHLIFYLFGALIWTVSFFTLFIIHSSLTTCCSALLSFALPPFLPILCTFAYAQNICSHFSTKYSFSLNYASSNIQRWHFLRPGA